MKRGDVTQLTESMYIEHVGYVGNEGDIALVLGELDPWFGSMKVLVNGYIGQVFRCSLQSICQRAHGVL